ncbi:MAG: bilirubin oxidase [Polyangiaceae bacterium]
MVSRRQFFKIGAGGATLFLMERVGGGVVRTAEAAIPGGSLDPLSVDKFVTPLLIPPVMPRAGKVSTMGGQQMDYYEIAVRQFSQQVLPPNLPATTLWGYGPVGVMGTAIFNAPSLTIEATQGRPLQIRWINELVDQNGNYLPHLLTVDPSLHWANPPGGEAGRDKRPVSPPGTTVEPYAGPVPIVTHVHGAVGVGDESDGYTEAWYLPNAANIPNGYATVGTWYSFFRSKAEANGILWQTGSATFQYPNSGRASTLWYHDHALGMTRLNVYAGPAGFFLIRGGASDDVRDAATGKPAKLPGPAPTKQDLQMTDFQEIPLAIQDRSFHTNGSLFYPDSRAFFDGITQVIPDTDISPFWNPEFFGNMIIVNGRTWPKLTVKQRRYRFRALNGCQSRFLILDFEELITAGARVFVIGNDGGFLDAVVDLATAGNQLVMGPAERMDLIVDFGAVGQGQYTLRNVGPDEPFAGGVPGVDFEPADPASTGMIMRFDVVPTTGTDSTTPANRLVLPAVPALPPESVTRQLVLGEMVSELFEDAPTMAVLGTGTGGVVTLLEWGDPVTENPATGAVELWEIYNLTRLSSRRAVSEGGGPGGCAGLA